MKKLFLFFTLLIFTINLNAQVYNSCEIIKSENFDIYRVEKKDLTCIAQNSEKPFTLIYTLAYWCGSCMIHFPDAFELGQTDKINLFVVLVDPEHDPYNINSIQFLNQHSENIAIGILKDEIYSKKVKKRNNLFTKEMTSTTQEYINDFGKFILLNKNGEILFTSSYKDFDRKDWKNSKKMVENKILPLIQ